MKLATRLMALGAAQALIFGLLAEGYRVDGSLWPLTIASAAIFGGNGMAVAAFLDWQDRDKDLIRRRDWRYNLRIAKRLYIAALVIAVVGWPLS